MSGTKNGREPHNDLKQPYTHGPKSGPARLPHFRATVYGWDGPAKRGKLEEKDGNRGVWVKLISNNAMKFYPEEDFPLLIVKEAGILASHINTDQSLNKLGLGQYKDLWLKRVLQLATLIVQSEPDDLEARKDELNKLDNYYRRLLPRVC